MPSANPTIPVLACLAAFASGSIPFGLLLVKLAGKGDVRTHGSGNIGATNVSRVGGKRLGIVTLFLDIAKGFLPIFLAKRAGLGFEVLSLMALAAVLGHVFTPWLKFQGGKGVATALGVILAVDPALCALPLGIFVFSLWLTRHVSLGSIMAAAMLPAELLLVRWGFLSFGGNGKDVWVVLPWLLLAALVIWKHRENIKRLQAGTESKLWGARTEASHGQA